MKKKNHKNHHQEFEYHSRLNHGYLVLLCSCALVLSGICGCAQMSGYSNDSLFPENVSSVYVEMFENETFWRNVEYDLSDALAKRIETDTPYKIVTSRNRADTIISGKISSIRQSLPTIERETGRALEKEIEIRAVVNWKNLKTGQLLIDSRTAFASASYSEFQNQGFRYASGLAANKLAQRIVELMEKKW